MKDLVAMANSIDPNLSVKERRVKFCELFLEELKTLSARDLEKCLQECVFDLMMPGTRMILRFPAGSHVFNADCLKPQEGIKPQVIDKIDYFPKNGMK